MSVGFQLHPTGPGLLCAAAAVAAGAPLFSDGLRALRLRRSLANLRSTSLDQSPSGFVHLNGRVALESPLFAPLSSRPCAGFRLEVRASGSPSMRFVEEHRRFLLVEAGRSARVMEQNARWELSVSAERDIAPDDSLSEHLTALIQRVPEMIWARSAGATLHLVERALCAGAECHVIGQARAGRVVELEPEVEWQRTGTDDLPGVAMIPAGGAAGAHSTTEPDVWIGNGEDSLLVTDQRPDPRHLSIPAWRVLGAVAGPVLSLTGLAYLANALDALRSLGNP